MSTGNGLSTINREENGSSALTVGPVTGTAGTLAADVGVMPT